jgi:hypothetical protein
VVAESIGLTSESDVEEYDGFAFPRLGYGNFGCHYCFGGGGRIERMGRRELEKYLGRKIVGPTSRFRSQVNGR